MSQPEIYCYIGLIALDAVITDIGLDVSEIHYLFNPICSVPMFFFNA